MSKALTWRISGDAGDSAFQLALMHTIGGQHIIRCVDRPGVTSPWTPRVPLIKKLFEEQPYVESVEISEEDPDIDLVGFRRFHSSVTTLVGANRSEYQMQSGKMLKCDGAVPWLTVTPDASFRGKIIIARSPRYNNPRFPWEAVVEHYGPRLVFVGLIEEHVTFTSKFGDVPHLRTSNLHEVAQAIAGADLFIGNQSSPHAVALGLGSNIISEVCPEQPDCIYPRKNVQYVGTGECLLPDVSKSGARYCPAHVDIPEHFNTSMVPPDFWCYDGLPPNTCFPVQQLLVAQKEKCTPDEAFKKLFRFNAMKNPRFFNSSGTGTDPMHLFNIALANAFPAEKKPLPA